MINLPNQAARQRERLLFEREITIAARSARRQLRVEINRVSGEAGNLYRDGVRSGIAADLLPDHQKNIRKILQGLYIRSMEIGSDRLLRSAKSMMRFNLETKADVYQLALDQWLAEILPLRVQQITLYSKNRILMAVEQGIAAGESPRKIASRLRKSGIGRVRAERIARTESLASASASQHKTAQQINPEFKKRWVATLDSRTRDTHDSADGQTRGMQLDFNIGGSKMQYPRDVGAPAKEVVNCRCVVVYED